MPTTTPGAHGTDPFDQARVAARELARRTGVDHHDALVVLGTGLGEVAGALGAAGTPLDLASLPWFDRFTAPGHRGAAWSVPAGTRHLLVVGGRTHLYEGHSPAEVVHTVRTAVAAGCGVVLLTCAAGAVSPALAPGQVVAVSDHLNWTGASPLTGVMGDQPAGSPFVDLTDAWSPRLRALAAAVDPTLTEGVYAQLPGPHLETPAEVRALGRAGADLVGMSMALEAIAARHLGAEVLGLAVVTNAAAGTPGATLDSGSIEAVARRAVPSVAQLLAGVIGRLGD